MIWTILSNRLDQHNSFDARHGKMDRLIRHSSHVMRKSANGSKRGGVEYIG